MDKSNKIAFLFLLIDNPNFPQIWDYYFKDHHDKINIYIHPKYPHLHTWKPKCIIKNLQPTGWGFIVDAYMELFREAFKNPLNTHFVTISESCLPIKPFDSFYSLIIKHKPNISLIKIMKISRYDWDVRLSNQIKYQFKNHLIKHYARMCLTKSHVSKLLSNKNKVKIFGLMHVGDEFFLSSITPLVKSSYIDFAITHDDWEYIDRIKKQIKKEIGLLYDKQELTNQDQTIHIEKLRKNYDNIAKNPKKIIKVSKEDLDNMKKTKSFFYRKFDVDSDILKYIYDFI